MLFTAHNLNKAVPTDLAFIHGRVRAETMRAEDVLHDVGVFSERTSARAITGAQVQNLDHMKRSGITQPPARSREA
jgi:urease alpha subunit